MAEKSRSARAVDRAAAVRQQVADREAKLKALRMHYARFGERVMNAVFHAYEHEGGLRRLVHRVTGRVVIQENSQHEVLSQFINKHGDEVFLRQARGDEGRITGDSTLADPDTALTAAPKAAAPPPTRPGAKRVRLPDGRVIEDRRSGRERRRGRDRRSALDTVYKNKRYGGDRRRIPDRRRSPAPPAD